MKILYKSGYKYQLCRDYTEQTRIRPEFPVTTEWIALDTTGNLVVKDGYAWNGASGPTIDTKSSMRPSLVHDAKCQLMQLGLLDWKWLPTANEEFYHACLEDGMISGRAYLWYLGLKIFSDRYVKGEGPDQILEAP